MLRKIFRLSFLLPIFILILFCGGTIKAATITVNTLVDENNTGANCSLREAITAANNNAAFGGCTAGSGTDSIAFSVSGSIDVTASLPNLASSMNIGSNTTTAPTITVNRAVGSNFRFLSIDDAITVNISGIAFNNGYAINLQGGAIDSNNNTVTLTNCVFTNNRATFDGGAVRNNGGIMNVVNCTFAYNLSDDPSGQGGGLKANGGTTTVSGSTFAFNKGNAGGGLHVGTGSTGTVVTNSTFYGNTATFGGGVEIRTATTFRNCTYTRNVASAVGGLNIIAGAVTLINTIVSGNLDPNRNASDVELGGGGSVAAASTNNLIGSAGGTGITNGVNGNIVGTNDPKLASLRGYGGITQTAPPAGNSAALNAGTNTGGPATDQRGAPRTNGGGATDIGAVEADFVVNLTTDVSDTTNGDGLCDTNVAAGSQCTLRAAIQEANAFAGYQIIAFSLTVPATMTPGTVYPNLSSDLAILGPGAANLTINGNNSLRLFTVNSGATDVILGLKAANGHAASSGGGIVNQGTLTLDRVTVDHCTSDAQSGGIENGASSTLNIVDSTISFNTATTLDGGGVATFGVLNVDRSTFVGNSSDGNGGGIAVMNGGAAQGSLAATNSTFSANSAGTTGGALSFDTSAASSITNCTITLNVQINAGQSGGGIGFAAGTAVLKNTIVANNTKNGGTQSDITGTASATSSFNLIGTGGAGGLTNGINSNQIGVADAKLTPLGNYGGLTQTHILSGTSSAVNAGTGTGAPTTDQRGSTRPFGGSVDIGAVELTITVTPTILSSGTVGTNYNQTYSATGESGDFTFSEVGTLPTGMFFSTVGANLDGTPTQTGSFPICVIATDNTFGIAGAICHTLTINAQVVHHFAIASISSPKVAGTAFNITITAQDSNNNTVLGFTGTVGLSTNAGSITPSTSGAFTSGVRTQSVTVTQSGTLKTITANDGSGHSGTSNTFTVNPGSLDHFGLSALASQTAGTAFNVTITAQDLNNNTVTSFVSSVGLTTTAGTITPTTSGAFTSGVRTQSVTVTQAGLGKTISANDGGGGHTGTSGAFNVNAGTLDHFAIDPLGTKLSGLPFNITVTAQDVNNNTVTGIVSRSVTGFWSREDALPDAPGFAGTVTLTTTAGTVTPGTSNAFTNGALTQAIAVSGSGMSVTVSVNDGAGHTATSNAFRVNAPTASTVAIVGQVRTADGRAVHGATVTLTDMAGQTRYARSNPFGYYRFDDVSSGQTYVVAVEAKQHTFTPRVVSLTEATSALDLIAQE